MNICINPVLVLGIDTFFLFIFLSKWRNVFLISYIVLVCLFS
jgi:hypothetical protein